MIPCNALTQYYALTIVYARASKTRHGNKTAEQKRRHAERRGEARKTSSTAGRRAQASTRERQREKAEHGTWRVPVIT